MTEEIQWFRTSFGEPELSNVCESVHQEHISQGVVTQRFEDEFAKALGVPYAVATTSGSVSLLMALMALDIGRDDEVIVPNRTWIATAHAAMLVGAKVILVDVRPDIPVLDTSKVREKITPQTKAIIAVHLNGRAVEMEELREIASDYGLHLIEDACQSLFSMGPDGFLGTLSDIGCFSFAVTKLVSTGQGGMAVTKKKEIYEKLKLIRSHGVADIFTSSWNQVGFNFKFTDLLASFGLAQLERVPKRLDHLRKIYERYAQGVDHLSFLSMVPLNIERGEIPIYAEFLCPEREELVSFLESQSIQARPTPPNIDNASYIKSSDSFINSKKFDEQGLYLPGGPEQPLENIDKVVDILRTYTNR